MARGQKQLPAPVLKATWFGLSSCTVLKEAKKEVLYHNSRY
jgi:hypothetical protein